MAMAQVRTDIVDLARANLSDIVPHDTRLKCREIALQPCKKSIVVPSETRIAFTGVARISCGAALRDSRTEVFFPSRPFVVGDQPRQTDRFT